MTVLSTGNALECDSFAKVKIGNPSVFEQATQDASHNSGQEL